MLRAIGKLFTGKHKKRVNEMLKQVNALIAAAEKANTEGVKPQDGKAKMSIIGEQGAEALDRAEEATTRLDNLNVAREMETSGKSGYKRIELNAKKTPVDMIAPYILHEVQHAIQEIEGFAGGGNLSSLQSDENETEKEAYDYYRKIAGEVEARNVSARINMTPEERRATLLSETEDVAREDQIFLSEGVEMAMAEAEDVKSEDRLTKHKTEEIFGGIWIADKKEFAKFASSVDTSPFEEDGEGIAFTDNYFYAYYRNIDGQVIPYASVYLNRNDSQDVVNESRKEIANVRKGERAKFYFDRAVVRFRTIQRENNANNGNHQSISLPVRNSGVVRRLLRKGRYYDTRIFMSKLQELTGEEL